MWTETIDLTAEAAARDERGAETGAAATTTQPKARAKPRSRKRRFRTDPADLLAVNVKRWLGYRGTIEAVLTESHPLVIAAAVDRAQAKRDRCPKGTQAHASWSVAYYVLIHGADKVFAKGGHS